MLRIRALTLHDLPAFAAHVAREERGWAEHDERPSGPYSKHAPRGAEEIAARALPRWRRPLSACDWQRAWGLLRDDDVVGHASLTGAGLPTALHRCTLGVAIERPHRAQGHGRKLVEEAVAWARAQPMLDWIDLGVFDGNDAAAALYRKLGFVERGRTVDRFRVDGVSIDDVDMSLRLR